MMLVRLFNFKLSSGCHQKSVFKVYRNLCDNCAIQKNVCAGCSGAKSVNDNNDNDSDEGEEENNEEDNNTGMELVRENGQEEEEDNVDSDDEGGEDESANISNKNASLDVDFKGTVWNEEKFTQYAAKKYNKFRNEELTTNSQNNKVKQANPMNHAAQSKMRKELQKLKST